MKSIISKILMILGIILLILTVLSIIGTLKGGGSLPVPNFSSGFMISYSIGACIGYYGPCILGIIFIIVSRILSSNKIDAKRAAKKAENEAASNGMVHCPECGATVKNTQVFCPKCHTKIDK